MSRQDGSLYRPVYIEANYPTGRVITRQGQDPDYYRNLY